MINENTVYDIYNKFGIEDNAVIMEEFNKITNNNDVPNNIKSKAYCGIGDLILFLEPYSSEDAGYTYYKKALEYDKNNIDARIGICIVFNEYPTPINTILTEKEYIENLEILVNEFDKIIDEKKKENIIQLIKNFIQYNSKKIR